MTEVYLYGKNNVPILSRAATRMAVQRWEMGRRTDQIARFLSVPEAAVYNSLSLYREIQREAA